MICCCSAGFITLRVAVNFARRLSTLLWNVLSAFLEFNPWKKLKGDARNGTAYIYGMGVLRRTQGQHGTVRYHTVSYEVTPTPNNHNTLTTALPNTEKKRFSANWKAPTQRGETIDLSEEIRLMPVPRNNYATSNPRPDGVQLGK